MSNEPRMSWSRWEPGPRTLLMGVIVAFLFAGLNRATNNGTFLMIGMAACGIIWSLGLVLQRWKKAQEQEQQASR